MENLVSYLDLHPQQTPWHLWVLPILDWATRSGEISRCVDQSHMREGLRKIAEQPFAARIIFFGQQPNIISYV